MGRDRNGDDGYTFLAGIKRYDNVHGYTYFYVDKQHNTHKNIIFA
jgi:hypothetical protein